MSSLQPLLPHLRLSPEALPESAGSMYLMMSPKITESRSRHWVVSEGEELWVWPALMADRRPCRRGRGSVGGDSYTGEGAIEGGGRE